MVKISPKQIILLVVDILLLLYLLHPISVQIQTDKTTNEDSKSNS